MSIGPRPPLPAAAVDSATPMFALTGHRFLCYQDHVTRLPTPRLPMMMRMASFPAAMVDHLGPGDAGPVAARNGRFFSRQPQSAVLLVVLVLVPSTRGPASSVSSSSASKSAFHRLQPASTLHRLPKGPSFRVSTLSISPSVSSGCSPTRRRGTFQSRCGPPRRPRLASRVGFLFR